VDSFINFDHIALSKLEIPLAQMVHKRKSKSPITKPSATKPSLDSAKPKSTRTVIRRFHVLLKRQANLQKQALGSSARELQSVESELASLGGLEAYQNMSAIGQGKDRGGGSEVVLIQWLKELGLANRAGGGKGKEKER
jgi:25S rRNA (adenine2142-N1)-methyltransferase